MILITTVYVHDQAESEAEGEDVGYYAEVSIKNGKVHTCAIDPTQDLTREISFITGTHRWWKRFGNQVEKR